MVSTLTICGLRAHGTIQEIHISQSSCCMNLFYSPCSRAQSNNSELNYIHPDRGQETHTHSKTWPSYTHPSLCVFVCVNLCASLGRTVSPELLHWHIFSSIHYPHRQTRLAECVCVCVCEGREGVLCGRRGPRGELWW